MAYEVEPFFLEHAQRQLFSLFFSNPKLREIDRGVLILPAFAEEMNNTRRFTYRLASELAARGHGVLCTDFSGTGDSSGDFENTRLENWSTDALAALRYLEDKYPVVNILSIRASSLLVPGLCKASREGFDKLCLLQPVDNGEQWLNEFLRLRVAKSLFDGARETLGSLKAELGSGSKLEVAGYQLSPALFEDLAGAKTSMSEISLSSTGLLIYLQRRLRANQEEKLRDTFSAWECSSSIFQGEFIEGDAFWSSDQNVFPEKLSERIVGYFA